MKIAILGYGRMGHEVERQAVQRGHEIAAVFDIDKPFTRESDLKGAETVISFTLADAVMENCKTAAALGVPIVEGTTGWYDQLEEIKQIKNLTLLYSPNFSIGVYVFFRLTECLSGLMSGLPDYDAYLHEWHHIGKADSPSGTAIRLAEILLDQLPQKKNIKTETSHGAIDPETLHVTSTRVGNVPGTHQIGFDSAPDSIEIKHTARSREGLALGAVKAAEWLVDKSGVYSMDDFMKMNQE
ncbi:MAG: 4-hydroxy-tetrahydrodipicolinate reductase [candidate division KSB1 bacterium]|nr:4-hydroxy-tetrahydrodipicolinate reductase [candidate division KSB1 bacterium]